MMDRKFTAIPSVEDSRDYKATMIIPTLQVFPQTFRLEYHGEIKNQGQIGSCVAHSASYTREIVEEKQSGTYKKFSVGYVYGNRADSDYQGEGMQPREMLKNLQAYGDVLYEDFPYNEEYPIMHSKVIENRDVLAAKAAPYKITSYCRLNDSDEIKSALMQLGPVTICMPVYQPLMLLTKSNAIVPIPGAQEKCLGYHEVTIVGWTVINGQEYWIVLNSWGSDWADGGYFYMPFDYPLVEAWSITDSLLPQKETDPEKHLFYRVQSRAYSLQCWATRTLDCLKKAGFNAVLDKYENRYVVQIAAFTEADKDKATSLLNDLKKVKCTKFTIRYY